MVVISILFLLEMINEASSFREEFLMQVNP